jgi:ABC-2 type transport system ATP-binding protein
VSAPGATVVFDRVSRWYGDTVALADVSFSLAPGVTGLLGHNGAGKSTALKLCAGFTRPSAGSVRVLGTDLARDQRAYRDIGIAHDREGLWPHLTAHETVAALARLRGAVDPRDAATRALARVGLAEHAGRRVGGFSHGMRQRVKLAQALAHGPRLLLLDEPLNGLDPAWRRRVIELIIELGEDGRTVLVSSHVLHEVERMAARILVLVDGRLVARGTTAGIRDLFDDRPREYRVRSDDPRALARELLAAGVVDSVALGAGSLRVEVGDAESFARAVAPAARRAGARLEGLEPLGEDLESIFRHLQLRARGSRR